MKKATILFLALTQFIKASLNQENIFVGGNVSQSGACTTSNMENCCRNVASYYENAFYQNWIYERCKNQVTASEIVDDFALVTPLQHAEIISSLEKLVDSSWENVVNNCYSGEASDELRQDIESSCTQIFEEGNNMSSETIDCAGSQVPPTDPNAPSCQTEYSIGSTNTNNNNSSGCNNYLKCNAKSYFDYFYNNYFQDPFFYVCPGMFLYLANSLITDPDVSCDITNPSSVCRQIFNNIMNIYSYHSQMDYNINATNGFFERNTDGMSLPVLNNCTNCLNKSPNLTFSGTGEFNWAKAGNPGFYQSGISFNPTSLTNGNINKAGQNIYDIFRYNYPKQFFDYVILPFINATSFSTSAISSAQNEIFSRSEKITYLTPLFTPINSQSGPLYSVFDEKLKNLIQDQIIDYNKPYQQEQNCLAQDGSTEESCINNYNEGVQDIGPGFQLCSFFTAKANQIISVENQSGKFHPKSGYLNYRLPGVNPLVGTNVSLSQISSFLPAILNAFHPMAVYFNTYADNGAYPQGTEYPYCNLFWPAFNATGLDIGNSIIKMVMGSKLSGCMIADYSCADVVSSAEKNNSFKTTFTNGLYPKLYNCCQAKNSTNHSVANTFDQDSYICALSKLNYYMYYNLKKVIQFSFDLQDGAYSKMVSETCGQELTNDISGRVKNFENSGVSACIANGSCSSASDQSSSCGSCLAEALKNEIGRFAKKGIVDCVYKLTGADSKDPKNCKNDKKIDNIFTKRDEALTALAASRVALVKFVYDNAIDTKGLYKYIGKCANGEKTTLKPNEICTYQKTYKIGCQEYGYTEILGFSGINAATTTQSNLSVYMNKKIYQNCLHPLNFNLFESILSLVMMPLGYAMGLMDPFGLLVMVAVSAVQQVVGAQQTLYQALSSSELIDTAFTGGYYSDNQ